MTENEAIKILVTEKYCLDKSTKGLCKINCGDCKENISIAYQEKAYEMVISALKEIQQYREIGTVEECKELASMVTTEKKNVLGQIVDEWKEYIEIGTMEECRKSVEKQIAKQCDIDSCPDHIHYKCPSCGQIELSVYKHGFPRLGRITKYCENCGQALIDIENLEGMEDE